MVTSSLIVPDRGDVIWLTLYPRTGHEQSGRRPVLVLSPKMYNHKVGLFIACPITHQVKGYPFEVIIPDGYEVNGAILADQIKSLDWQIRDAKYICSLPPKIVIEVLKKLETLISLN